MFNRSVFAGAAAVAALAVLASAPARASDVYWSVGVQAAPGVTIGATNAPPVYYQPAPVYVRPAPVYVQPQPVYYVRPAPVVVYQPAPIFGTRYYGVPPGHGHWKHKNKHRGHGHRD